MNYYAMGYTVQAGQAHGSQPDALAYWFVSGLKRPCMDITVYMVMFDMHIYT